MFKKFFSIILLIAAIFVTAPVQAESNFDFNQNFNNRLVFKSNIRNGIVSVSSYLVLRKEPNANSREIMRIPNGAELVMRDEYIPGWISVLSVSFDGKTFANDTAGDSIGYVRAKYVKFY